MGMTIGESNATINSSFFKGLQGTCQLVQGWRMVNCQGLNLVQSTWIYEFLDQYQSKFRPTIPNGIMLNNLKSKQSGLIIYVSNISCIQNIVLTIELDKLNSNKQLYLDLV